MEFLEDRFQFEGETSFNVEELLEKDRELGSSALMNGEWDDSEEVVYVDSSEFEEAIHGGHVNYAYEERSGLNKIFIPIDLPFDGLRYIGRKSTELKPRFEQESKIKDAVFKISAAGILYDFGSESFGINELPEIPETTSTAFLVGLFGSHVLKGRVEAKYPELDKDKSREFIQELDDERLDYEVHAYPFKN